MPVNKVDINGETILDLTNDTINDYDLLEGFTAHNKEGDLIEGRMKRLTVQNARQLGLRTYITPSSTDLTILDSNGYFDSIELIVEGAPTLVPENIVKGISIFGVAGAFETNQFRTGTSEPDNSIGSDGDWYLVTEE